MANVPLFLTSFIPLNALIQHQLIIIFPLNLNFQNKDDLMPFFIISYNNKF